MSRFSTIRALQKHPKYIHTREVVMTSFRRDLVRKIFSAYDEMLINRILPSQGLYRDQITESLQNDNW